MLFKRTDNPVFFWFMNKWTYRSIFTYNSQILSEVRCHNLIIISVAVIVNHRNSSVVNIINVFNCARSESVHSQIRWLNGYSMALKNARITNPVQPHLVAQGIILRCLNIILLRGMDKSLCPGLISIRSFYKGFLCIMTIGKIIVVFRFSFIIVI